MKFGSKLMDWLKDITPDQNLNDLDELTDGQMNGKRRWWTRRDLTPTLSTAYYNPATGKYVLGPAPPSLADARSVVTGTTFTTVSLNTLRLTCPANRARKVTVGYFANHTRAPTWSAIYTPIGGTAVAFCQCVNVGIVSAHIPIIGGIIRSANSVQANGPIWMREGDLLDMFNDNFVAADNTEFGYMFEEWVV